MRSQYASYPLLRILRTINSIWHQDLQRYKTLTEGMIIEEKNFKVALKIYLNVSSFFSVD
jgi:hypothetical protein